jgi:putative hydrolase of the HAD superfamily
MAIKGIIFDLGHTLMYLDSTWPVVWQHGTADLEAFLEEQELTIDAKAFTQAFLERRAVGFELAKATLREVTAEDSMSWTLAQFGVLDPSPALVGGAIDAFFAYEEAHWLPYPGACSLLRELADRELRLGMYSNATHDPLIQRLVDHLGFRHWLEPALSSAVTGIRKPDPTAFAPILTSWRLGPDSVVVVGDTLAADILGAQKAGMLSVWFPSHQDARQEGDSTNQARDTLPAIPDATIKELSDLPACLEGF